MAEREGRVSSFRSLSRDLCVRGGEEGSLLGCDAESCSCLMEVCGFNGWCCELQRCRRGSSPPRWSQRLLRCLARRWVAGVWCAGGDGTGPGSDTCGRAEWTVNRSSMAVFTLLSKPQAFLESTSCHRFESFHRLRPHLYWRLGSCVYVFVSLLTPVFQFASHYHCFFGFRRRQENVSVLVLVVAVSLLVLAIILVPVKGLWFIIGSVAWLILCRSLEPSRLVSDMEVRPFCVQVWWRQ